MELKKQTSFTLLKALACAVLTLGFVAATHAEDAKADPAGTWTWVVKGRNDNSTTNKLELKYADKNLTGTIKTPKRGGEGENSTEITDGKFDGTEVTFKVSREAGGNTITMSYKGTVTADAITGTIETERNGKTRSRKWEAKRETAK